MHVQTYGIIYLNDHDYYCQIMAQEVYDECHFSSHVLASIVEFFLPPFMNYDVEMKSIKLVKFLHIHFDYQVQMCG